MALIFTNCTQMTQHPTYDVFICFFSSAITQSFHTMILSTDSLRRSEKNDDAAVWTELKVKSSHKTFCCFKPTQGQMCGSDYCWSFGGLMRSPDKLTWNEFHEHFLCLLASALLTIHTAAYQHEPGQNPLRWILHTTSATMKWLIHLLHLIFYAECIDQCDIGICSMQTKALCLSEKCCCLLIMSLTLLIQWHKIDKCMHCITP